MDGYELAPSLAQLCVRNGWQAGECLGRRLLEFRLFPKQPSAPVMQGQRQTPGKGPPLFSRSKQPCLQRSEKDQKAVASGGCVNRGRNCGS